MPRQGDGSSDNGPFAEAQHDIIHGAGEVKVSNEPYQASKTHDTNNISLTTLTAPTRPRPSPRARTRRASRSRA